MGSKMLTRAGAARITRRSVHGPILGARYARDSDVSAGAGLAVRSRLGALHLPGSVLPTSSDLLELGPDGLFFVSFGIKVYGRSLVSIPDVPSML